MIALFRLCLALFASPFKSKSRLEAENAALRHQLIILRRKVRGRVRLMNGDRLFFIQLYRWFPSVLKAITIVRPETLVRWHRAGFRRYWRWKSRSLGGRPKTAADLRALIRQMIGKIHYGVSSLKPHTFSRAAAQIGLAHAIVIAQRRAVTARDDRSCLQHVTSARGLQRVARVLLDKEDARASGINRLDGAKNILHDQRGETE